MHYQPFYMEIPVQTWDVINLKKIVSLAHLLSTLLSKKKVPCYAGNNENAAKESRIQPSQFYMEQADHRSHFMSLL